MLASEYGWAKKEIWNEVYFDELYFLLEQINKRKASEYKMQLAIIQNPHVKDPKALWKILDEQNGTDRPETLDVEGLDRLKGMIGGFNNSKMVIKQ